MYRDVNPFQQLYVSEAAQGGEFVKIFSPVLVKNFLPLFQQGNTIMRGTQGSGKTMLLNLLKPETRLAYFAAGEEYPIPKIFRSFISAGINIIRSDALGIGQRPIGNNPEQDIQLFPLYFADFVNYWLVLDLLESVKTIGDNPLAFDHLVRSEHLDNFACSIATNDCWFGYLSKATNFDELHKMIKERIYIYREFHQFNLVNLPSDIFKSKTNIGQPISATAVQLKKTNVISEDTSVFIRIDQLESLLESDEIRPELGREYRRIINKALSTRDPALSYKIGSRTHAWLEEMKIWRTESDLEHERDYRISDIDEVIRRKENTQSWIMPEFASDVFRRRLIHVGYSLTDGKQDLLVTVLGPGLDPKDVAKKYTQNSQTDHALKLPIDWPESWLRFLSTLFETDPLDAKLASAWVRQKGVQRSTNRLKQPPPTKPPWPWDRLWWRKERIRQALAQLAAHSGQRAIWAGKDQVVALSGNNILIFLSLCQYIWDAYLRTQRDLERDQRLDPLITPIPPLVQAIAIHSASSYWFNKISELPVGTRRKRFIELIGRKLQKELLDDLAMSYPGHNGFSIANDELSGSQTHQFLKQAVNYGILFESPHTTKTGDRRSRTKWYLNPIYSPHFGIPETHVKEPIYTSLKAVDEWLRLSEGVWEGGVSREKTKEMTPQLNLFRDTELRG